MRLLNHHRTLPGSAAFVSASAALVYVVVTIATAGANVGGIAAVIAILTAAIAEALRRRQLDRLRVTVARTNRHSTFVVYVNGVAAGKISATQYRQLELDAWLDARNYVKQFAAMCAFVGNCLWIVMLLVPVTLFWGVVMQMWFDPHAFGTTLSSLASLLIRDVDVHAVARLLLRLAGLCWFTLAAAMLVFRFGYSVENSFQADHLRRVRCVVGSTAAGEITLVNDDGATVSQQR
jgi:hypothetical protein